MRRIFGMAPGMKSCPPKPGSTVITRTRSSSGRTSSSTTAEVAGLSASPTRLSSFAIDSSVRWRTAPPTCTVSPSAAASAKASRYDRAPRS